MSYFLSGREFGLAWLLYAFGGTGVAVEHTASLERPLAVERGVDYESGYGDEAYGARDATIGHLRRMS